MKKIIEIALLGLVFAALGGCSMTPRQASDLKRSAIVGTAAGVGGVAAGGIGLVASGGNPVVAGVSAAAGGGGSAALATHLLGPDKAAMREEYERGSEDALKQLYFSRNDIERQKASMKDAGAGKMSYYTVPARAESTDGTQYVPHDVTVPILE